MGEGAQSVLESVLGSELTETIGISSDDTVVVYGGFFGDGYCGLSLDELMRRVSDYRIRSDEDPFVPDYLADNVGHYKIFSAKDAGGRRTVLPNIIHGRFVDVVAYAVRQDKFYFDLGLGIDTRSSNNGYLVGIGFENESVIEVARVSDL